ncbi:MAG: hypothetical protein R6T87_02190 [Marinobacter sp.]
MAFSPPSFTPVNSALFQQSLAVLKEYLPSPAPVLGVIDRSIPVPLKQLIAEAPLNHMFARAIAECPVAWSDYQLKSSPA